MSAITAEHELSFPARAARLGCRWLRRLLAGLTSAPPPARLVARNRAQPPVMVAYHHLVLSGRRSATIALAGLGALTLLGLGCGGQSPATSRADQQFLEQIHGQSPDIKSYRSDPQLLRLGEAICADFDSGASAEQVGDRVPLEEGTPVLPADDLGVVMTAAVSELCPKYHSLLGQ